MLPQIETKSSVGFEVGVKKKKKKLVTKKNWCYRLRIDLSYFLLYRNGDELYRTLTIALLELLLQFYRTLLITDRITTLLEHLSANFPND